jgi:hypothetical protein
MQTFFVSISVRTCYSPTQVQPSDRSDQRFALSDFELVAQAMSCHYFSVSFLNFSFSAFMLVQLILMHSYWCN